MIPEAVYTELSNPSIIHLKARVDTLLADNSARVEIIETDTAEYTLYRKLISDPDPGHAIIGNGEAAAIALAKERGGVLASNNMRDIAVYVKEFGLQHVTTGEILKEALEKGLITEDAGNLLWQDMLKKRRRLGSPTFSDYLEAKRKA